jgi:hypothetical protein
MSGWNGENDANKAKHIKDTLQKYENINKNNPLLPVKMLWHVISTTLQRLHPNLYDARTNQNKDYDRYDPNSKKGVYLSTTYYDAWVEEEFEKILNEQIEDYENNQPEHFKFTPTYPGGKNNKKRITRKQRNKKTLQTRKNNMRL